LLPLLPCILLLLGWGAGLAPVIPIPGAGLASVVAIPWAGLAPVVAIPGAGLAPVVAVSLAPGGVGGVAPGRVPAPSLVVAPAQGRCGLHHCMLHIPLGEGPMCWCCKCPLGGGPMCWC
jgi:hypothetical protein